MPQLYHQKANSKRNNQDTTAQSVFCRLWHHLSPGEAAARQLRRASGHREYPGNHNTKCRVCDPEVPPAPILTWDIGQNEAGHLSSGLETEISSSKRSDDTPSKICHIQPQIRTYFYLYTYILHIYRHTYLGRDLLKTKQSFRSNYVFLQLS